MKIRDGFVSNSSSSSFVVNREKRRWVPHSSGEEGRVETVYDVILTKKQEDDLVKFGFGRYKSYDTTEYTYEISCNQNCVMKFLIEHKIPFVACCHYGHEHYFWNGKSDNLIHLRNFGEEYAMYGNDDDGVREWCKAENMFKETAGGYVPVTIMTECTCEDYDLCKRG
jgi:hypothetical protein